MNSKILRWSDKQQPYLKTINLELTNHCNYICVFCLNGSDDFRSKGFISDNLIDKVVRELRSETHISVCGIGEPSLHPNFINIINLLSKKFTNLSIVTNGYLFRNEKLIRAVLDSNISKINLSLDYINPDSYRKTKGGEIDIVIQYIRDFIKIRSAHPSKPFLQINYLYEKEKKDYIEAITFLKEIMQEPWCIYIRKIKDLAGQVNIDEEKDEETLDRMFAGLIDNNVVVENWNRYLQNTNFKIEKPKICRHIYDYYMLLWNGDVVPCCVDFNANMVMANVLSEDVNLTDLFYAERYTNFRNKLERLDYSEFPLCRECNDYYKA